MRTVRRNRFHFRKASLGFSLAFALLAANTAYSKTLDLPVVAINDLGTVDKLADQLSHGGNPLPEGTILYHIPGRKEPPSIKRFFALVTERQIDLPAAVFDSEQYDELMDALEKAMPSVHDTESAIVAFESENGPLTATDHQVLARHFSGKNLITRLRGLRDRIFGTDLGFTWIEKHVYRIPGPERDEKGRWRFGLDWIRTKQTAAMTGGALAAVFLDLLFKAETPTDLNYSGLYAWTAVYAGLNTFFQRETASFELQGFRQIVSRQFPEGKQIVFDYAWPLIFSSRLISNLLGTCVAVALLPGEDKGLSYLFGAFAAVGKTLADLIPQKWKDINLLDEERHYHGGNRKGVLKALGISSFIGYAWGIGSMFLSLLPSVAKDQWQGLAISMAVFGAATIYFISTEHSTADNAQKTVWNGWGLAWEKWKQRNQSSISTFDCGDFLSFQGLLPEGLPQLRFSTSSN